MNKNEIVQKEAPKYVVVKSGFVLDLEKTVNEYLSEGYELAGNLFFISTNRIECFCQPLIKK